MMKGPETSEKVACWHIGMISNLESIENLALKISPAFCPWGFELDT